MLRMTMVLMAVAAFPAYVVDAGEIDEHSPVGTAAAGNGFTFFVIGDPQVNIPKWGTFGTEKTIDMMNRLPGQRFPFGGTVDSPRGVLVLGDLVDDLHNAANWERYTQLFAVKGDARLKFPAYETAGNHDLDGQNRQGEMSFIERQLVTRNRQRRSEIATCPLGFHYSWDWESVHFVNLNVFPGNVPRPVYDRPSPWNNPRRSLDFLKKDLAKRVGDSGRPVILMWHYGLVGWGREKWWTPEDLEALKDTITPYNVVLILHGHEHAYRKYVWEGYDVMMAPSPQFDRDPKKTDSLSQPKGFLVIRVRQDTVEVAHRAADGWRENWSKKIETTAGHRSRVD